MKLRLPHKFQAALIAALASVSMLTLSTGSSAYAANAILDAKQVFENSEIASTLTVDNWTAGPMTVAIEIDVNALRSCVNSTWVAGVGTVTTIFNCEGTWNSATGGRTDTEGLNINGSSTNKYGTPYGQGTSPNGSGTAVKFTGVSESLKFNSGTEWEHIQSISAVLTMNGATTMSSTWVVLKDDGTSQTYTGSNSGVKWGGSTAFTPDGTIKDINTDMVTYMAVFEGAKDATVSGTIAKDILERYDWNGNAASTTWDTTTANWLHDGNARVYKNGGNSLVTFGSDSGLSKTVDVSGAITAGDVILKDDYTFTMQDGGSLTAAALTIGGDGLTIDSAENATGTLKVNSAISAAGKTITVNDGAVLQAAAGSSFTLAGDGTYALADGATTKDSGVTLGDGWTGTVRISNVGNFQNIDIDNFGQSGSAVELNGVTGYFKSAQGAGVTFNSKLVIGTGGYTWKSQGYSNSTYELKGGIGGSGTFTYQWKAQTFKVTGDVADWNGSFVMDSSNDATFKFSGQATAVNAKFLRPKGTLNMEVGNGTESFSTTFKNTVEASVLTINANASATFENTASIGSITGAGDLYISNTGTLKLAGANTVSVGSLTLAEGAHLDVSNVIQMAGLTVNLASYTGTVTCTTDNITGLHSGMAYTLNTDNGQVTLTFAGEQPLPSHFTPTADLRNVMYVGDSITDGVTNQKSWRYSFFQVLADGGIGQNEEGYYQHHQSSGAIPEGTIATYGDREFQNTHSAQASARSYEVAGTDGPSQGRFDRSYIKNWLGQDDTKKNGQPYPEEKARYTGETAPNTYFMLLGTNDLLSDPSGSSHVSESHFNTVLSRMFGYSDGTYDGETGTFDIILDSMLKARSDAQLVIMEMPTWAPSRGGNHDSASDFAYMARFNQTLIGWAAGNANKEHITVVDPNRGMVDVANTTKPGAGVANMFIADGLHPSAQGELIMAGNMARQLGYAGRSVGLDRAEHGTPDTVWSSAESASITVVAEPQTFAQGEFHTLDGYTIDFGALYGNGITGGWSDPANALSVQVGDGLHSGTLSFSEAYVMWGDTILYSRDNSQEGDNFRIAYVNSSVNAADHVTAGYYVWMGDQLIGEALTSGSGDFNGIRLTSTGAEGTVKNLTWSDTAYAPITNGYVNEAAAFHLVQVNPNPNHDNTPQGIRDDINWQTTTDKFALPSGQSSAAETIYKEYSSTIGAAYTGAANANYEGNIGMRYTGDTDMDARQSVLSVWSATVTGNVYMQFDNPNTVYNSFTNTDSLSVTASYNGNITGSYTAVYNAGIFNYDVRGGEYNNDGYTIGGGSYSYVNGGTFKANVMGGGRRGTINGGTHVTVTGGNIAGSVYGGGLGGTINGGTHVTITGGIIEGDVIGGGTGGTINDGTYVTVEGILPYIKGDITAQNVTLKDMATSEEGYTDGFDCYTGTITATTLTLDNYKVDEMLADVVAESLVFTNGSATTFKGSVTVGTTIMGDNSTITLSGTSSIAGIIAGNATTAVVFDNDITSTGLERTTRDYNVGLDGQEIDVDVTDANYFAGAQEGTLTVVSGGAAVTTNGHNVVQDSISYALQDDGTAVGTVKEAEYATFYQHEAGSALDLSAINLVAAQHGQLLGVGKVDVEGATLTVDTGYVYNVVAKDATVQVASGEDVYGVGMLEFIGGENTVVGQVSNFGDHAAKFRENVESAVELKNADGSAYTLDLSSLDHVKFSTTAEDGGVVAISAAAEGDADEVYTAAESRYTVKATELAKATEGDATVGNHVEVAEVSNVFAGKLTLSSGAATEVLREITTSNGGDIEFLNMAAANGTEDGSQTLVQLKALEIGADSTVSFYENTEADPAEEARVTVETTLSANAGARLNADLEMAVGSALDVSGTEGLGLLLGSAVTLHEGNLLAVEGHTEMDYVDAYLRDYFGGRTDKLYVLYSGTEGDPLEFYIDNQLVDHDIKFKDWKNFDMDASEIYSNLYAQTYYLVYDGSNVGSIAIGLLPEPTTGTLSLLALCALAARRRRK